MKRPVSLLTDNINRLTSLIIGFGSHKLKGGNLPIIDTENDVSR